MGADTCDWPRCLNPATVTYSAGTPTVGLCPIHWAMMCANRAEAWLALKLKPKTDEETNDGRTR